MKREVLAIIPARGGSKGLPRKNLALLGGRPLVAWTIDAARRCPLVDRVIVSTEDEEIASASREAGAEVPFLRPPELAGDRALVNDAAFHTLGRLAVEEGYRPSLYLLLYPTSPFRTKDLLRRVLEPVMDSFFFSTTVLGEWVTSSTFADLRGERLHAVRPNVVDAPVYSAVGSAQACTMIDIEVIRDVERFRRHLDEGRRRGDRKCLNLFAFVELKDPAEEIDIDSAEDLELAEEVLRHGWFRP